MKVSIITATYNSARTLRDALESVLRQTYNDIELMGGLSGFLKKMKEYMMR